MTLADLLSEAEGRLTDARKSHADLEQQAREMNAHGIALEKTILGIEGEVKALRAALEPA